ncbi:MAG: intradiol ring-cleavage dioxygenase [Rubrivivax sp.]
MSTKPSPGLPRRRILAAAAVAVSVSAIAGPVLASSRRTLAAMTDGPFYPPRAWREQWADWDADLSRVQRDGRTLVARGEHLGLELQLADARGRLIDAAELEIWQCDALAAYRHPGVHQTAGSFDEGFQGFGGGRSDRAGQLRFRTIKPVPYPGRTPHIHVKLRHASFGEISSQLFIAGDPGNARDFLWRGLDPADRPMLDMALQAAAADTGLRWQARHTLVVPA